MVQINIEKKHLLILVIFLSLFTIALVIAVNPTTKPNPGHLSNEVMINVGGADKTLQAAIDDGSFGLTKVYDSGWQSVSASTSAYVWRTYSTGKGNFTSYNQDEPAFVVVKFSENPSDNSKPVFMQMAPSTQIPGWVGGTDVYYNQTDKQIYLPFGIRIGPYMFPDATSGKLRVIAYN